MSAFLLLESGTDVANLQMKNYFVIEVGKFCSCFKLVFLEALCGPGQGKI